MANPSNYYRSQHPSDASRPGDADREQAFPRRGGAYAGSSWRDDEDTPLAHPWRERDPYDASQRQGRSSSSGEGRFADEGYRSGERGGQGVSSPDYSYGRGHEASSSGYPGGSRREPEGRGYRAWDEDRGAPWMTDDGHRAFGPEGYRGGRRAEPWSGLQGGGMEGYPERGRGGGAFGGGQGYPSADERHVSGQDRQQRYDRFRGHGPKGYRRSDERIHEDVCEALSRDPYLDASSMDVKVEDGIVTLEGEASSRQMKHRAENCADACSGVKDVENRLKVRGSSSAEGGGSASAEGEGAGQGQPGEAGTPRH